MSLHFDSSVIVTVCVELPPPPLSLSLSDHLSARHAALLPFLSCLLHFLQLFRVLMVRGKCTSRHVANYFIRPFSAVDSAEHSTAQRRLQWRERTAEASEWLATITPKQTVAATKMACSFYNLSEMIRHH